eukprot:TRINITY_DN19115_c0_g2_i1.p1 TRINITY_DN19115_c0_g2~~TRINITY_DN19115_c0_g2_i1.p1  ORF type:complete len:130 (+),score=18.72 TRINITY_DN19115_c0_g2_i1:73-462(+)
MCIRDRSKQERQEEVDRAAQELKELRRIGHRLHAAELYGRQGKKQPYSTLDGGDATGAEASSFTTTVLPPIKRVIPTSTADPEDILIKSAQAKIKMLQLLRTNNANGNSSTTTTTDRLPTDSTGHHPEL